MARMRVKEYLVGVERVNMSFADKDGKEVKINQVHLHFLQIGNPEVKGYSLHVESISPNVERALFDGWCADDLLFHPVRLERYANRKGKTKLVAIDPAGDPDDLSKFLAATLGGRIVDLAKAPRQEYVPVGFDDDDE